MNDDYYDDEFTQMDGYCDIHGNLLEVLQRDSGDLFVNVKDVRKTGFALFRRHTFDPVLSDPMQISQEFELHLLSEAKKYILRNRINSIDEQLILKTIASCKNKILGDVSDKFQQCSRPSGSPYQNLKSNPAVSQRQPRPLNNFAPNNSNQQSQSRPQQQGEFNGDGNNSSQRDANARGGLGGSQSGSNSSLNQRLSSSQDRPQIPRKHDDPVSQTRREPSQTRREPVEIDSTPRVALEIGNVYKVKVAWIDEENDNVCWVQEEEAFKKFEELAIDIISEEPNLSVIANPLVGQYVIACFDELWCRAKVVAQNPTVVHYMDFGNKNTPESIKPLSQVFLKTPALAVRLVVNLNGKAFEDEMDLSVKIKTRYADYHGTYLGELVETEPVVKDQPSHTEEIPDQEEKKPVDEKKSVEVTTPMVAAKPVEVKKQVEAKCTVAVERALETAKSMDVMQPVEAAKLIKKLVEVKQTEVPVKKTFMGAPKALASVKNGDKIMLLDVLGKRFAVRTRECVEKSKMLITYIKHLNQSDSWFRGTVVSIEGNKFDVLTVDFGNTVTVTSDKIRRFPTNMKDIPIISLKCQCINIPSTPAINKKLKQHLTSESFSVKVVKFNKRNSNDI